MVYDKDQENLNKLINEALSKKKGSVLIEQDDVNSPHEEWHDSLETNVKYDKDGMGWPSNITPKPGDSPWAFKYNHNGHVIRTESDEDGYLYSSVDHPDTSRSKADHGEDDNAASWKWSPYIDDNTKSDITAHVDRFVKAFNGGH